MARTSNFIVMFNVVTLILGAIMFGMAIYTKQNFTDRWSNVISTGAVWVGIFAGLFMMIISGLGCYAARKNKKSLLCGYLVCVAILLTMQAAAAGTLINYAQRFRTVATQTSSSLSNGDDITVNNAVVSLYNYCCSGCNNQAVSDFSGGAQCSADVTLPRFCNTTRQLIASDGGNPSWTPLSCDTPVPCLDGMDNCWKINAGSIPLSQLRYPPTAFDRTFCTLLTTLQDSGSPLVGFPQQGGCGRGTIQGFLNAIDSYFSPKMYYAGVVFSLIAAIQGSVMFVGAYVICCVSRHDALGEEDDEYT